MIHIKLRRLDFTRTDLSSIRGEVLSEAVVRLSEVDLSSTCLTDLQLETLVRELKAIGLLVSYSIKWISYKQ